MFYSAPLTQPPREGVITATSRLGEKRMFNKLLFSLICLITQLIAPSAFGAAVGFLYSDGVYTTISIPGSCCTSAFGVTDSGKVVGSYAAPDGSGHQFEYNGGSFSTSF